MYISGPCPKNENDSCRQLTIIQRDNDDNDDRDIKHQRKLETKTRRIDAETQTLAETMEMKWHRQR